MKKLTGCFLLLLILQLGVWGADDPENRKPLHWPDTTTDEQLVLLGEQTTDRLSRWLRLRSDPAIGPVLRYGSVTLHKEGQLLVIERELDGLGVRLYANPTDTRVASAVGAIPARGSVLVRRDALGGWVDALGSSEKP